MATTFEFEDMASSNINSNVVPPKIKGEKLSLKKQMEKRDITEKMVADKLTGNFVHVFAQPPINLPPKSRQTGINWDAPTAEFPAEPDIGEPMALVADGTTAAPLEQKSKLEMSMMGPHSPGTSNVDEIEDMPSEDSTDSAKYFEVQGTPQALEKYSKVTFLKEKKYQTKRVESHASNTDDDFKSGPRKRPAKKKGKAFQKKMSKGLVGTPVLKAQQQPTLKSGLVDTTPRFWKTVPQPLAPDTPETSAGKKGTGGGEVPSTPLHRIRPAVALNGKKELLTILAEYEVPEELKDRLAALMDRMDQVIHQTTSYLVNLDERVQAMSGYEERLRALENAQTFAHPPTFAQKVSAFKPIFTAVPQPPTVSSVVPGPGVPGPSSAVDLPWHTVTSKRKAPTLPRSVQPKRKATSVPPSAVLKKPDVSLQPRSALPAVVVRPVGEVNVTSAQIKGVLEESIHPMQIGVKIISCQPVSGQGVLIRTETPAMAQKLEDEINNHPTLSGNCQAKAPNQRRPQIMVYDVPDSPGDRSEVEQMFIEKLRSSNNLPAGEIKVVFRRKGRGSLSHWVLSLAPAVFAVIRETKRLHWGFGSYRFREFCEPLQCFKCFRFGHVRPQCRMQTDLCAKCPGEHPTKDCPKNTVVCRNCREFNARNKPAARIPVAHRADSDTCPIFLRERAEMKQRTHYA
ncbi:hypothetical protein AVEN_22499-1 [Araneus ventricosus]|uniref:CCHC-type domain-containing protein n=1 Tax=Araneus ventricosus TaxID=182803 RepID=A0A4Y2RER1_ARAVE|nr:hypothetical protein AVEN_22499-1 [Araneus ventricosus]